MKKSELKQIIKEEMKKVLREANYIRPGKNTEVKEGDKILTPWGVPVYIDNINWKNNTVEYKMEKGESTWRDLGLYSKDKKLYLR